MFDSLTPGIAGSRRYKPAQQPPGLRRAIRGPLAPGRLLRWQARYRDKKRTAILANANTSRLGARRLLTRGLNYSTFRADTDIGSVKIKYE
jgi:hypothetical protein